MPFDPTIDSIKTHTIPNWFNDSKLGIFVHWGLYSIPGWAPTTGPLPEVIASQGWSGWFRNNPYAEWYMNSLRIADSATAQYHAEQYGADFPYERFAAMFNEQIRNWNPDPWADLFKAAGARYVVLTTKHHDGFLLWPSTQPNPFLAQYHTERDLVGELTTAVRSRGLNMGLYYSGGLDWTFNDRVIADISDLFMAVPQSAEYTAYSDAHWRELIERYAPSVLWNDIGYPSQADIPRLFAEYYNRVPEGIINDRFTQGEMTPDGPRPVLRHFDFRTPEYAVFNDIRPDKWEACRGLGFSFGYNRNETVTSMLSADALIHSFADIVSKNGNLLINVGPTGDGTIPSEQADRLLALGHWLETNGEAIYNSRPFTHAEGSTNDGTPVRYTRKRDTLYAMLLGTPQSQQITIEGIHIQDGGTVELLGHNGNLEWSQDALHLTVTLPANIPDSAAHTLRLPLAPPANMADRVGIVEE